MKNNILKVLIRVVLVLFMIYSIDINYIKGKYKIRNRFQYLYKLIIEKNKEINPRSIINLSYLKKQIFTLIEVESGLDKLFETLNRNIHPFIDYEFVKGKISFNNINYIKKVEQLMKREKIFPNEGHINTDISISYETHPLTVFEAIDLAGNVFVKEGRELYPKLINDD